MGSNDAPSKRLNQVDQDVIDVIGMLFDFILDDRNVPDAMKALLGRLQIPMLKVAVLDRSFFGNKQHPARRLLNTLARAAMGWVDDGDRSPKSLYGRIETAVSRIQRLQRRCRPVCAGLRRVLQFHRARGAWRRGGRGAHQPGHPRSGAAADCAASRREC